MNEKQIPNQETIPGPTDSLHKYLQEKRKRQQEGGNIDSLLSQELAFVGDNVVIADLNLLREEGTFDNSEKAIPKDEAKYSDILSLDKITTGDKLYSLENTNWDTIDQFILQYFQENSQTLKIKSIKDLDPSIAATIAYEIPKHFMNFNDEMGENPTGDKAVKIDTKTPDQLLTEKEGICRHFTKVSIAIYDRLKQIDEAGTLTDTVLMPVGNDLIDELPGAHAYCLLIAKRDETVLSIGDPTFLQMLDREVHTDLRLASLVKTLMENDMLDSLDIDRKTLISFIDEQLSRIDKGINVQKISLTKKAKGEDNNNQEYIEEQGFDERAKHFLTETSSIIQVVGALGTAKGLLQDEQNLSGTVDTKHIKTGSQAMFDFIKNKSDQLPPKHIIDNIKKILEPKIGIKVSLSLLDSITEMLTNIPKFQDQQAKDNIVRQLKMNLSLLKTETITSSSDESDPWAVSEKENMYSVDEIQNLETKIQALESQWKN